MIRIILYLLLVLACAAALHWLADRPGSVVIEWQGYVVETSVFQAAIMLALLLGTALFVWSLLRWLWSSPAVVGRFLNRRREKRGLDALSSGIIAVSAGDQMLALRYAGQARKALPNEPLTHLLRAQAAQLSGDRTTSRRIFEAMLASPDTEPLGLRGLFLEAQREGEQEAARQFAQRALKLNPKLPWPVEALFDIQCRAEDWQGALDTLAVGRRQKLIDDAVVSRRRAVLLTAQAQALEDTAADKALALATEAHRLAPDLVPAAAIAGRILASQGNTPRAARVLLKTWRRAPHPDLAVAYAYARPGDSPRDRLSRIRHLSRLTPGDNEGPIALAMAAVDAHDWDEARKALEPLLTDRLSQRVCTLMARIEGEQHGHAGRVREWLARAVNAPRDPAWTADGVVSSQWAPISPVTGALDAFRWRVPVEAVDESAVALAAKVEALVGLGADDREPALEHAPASKQAGTAQTEPVETIDPEPPATIAASSPGTAPVVHASRSADGSEDRDPATATRPGRDDPAAAAAVGAAATQVPNAASEPAAQTQAGPPAASRPARRTLEPKIFVPPRAPDDPGPDAGDSDIGALHPSGAKA